MDDLLFKIFYNIQDIENREIVCDTSKYSTVRYLFYGNNRLLYTFVFVVIWDHVIFLIESFDNIKFQDVVLKKVTIEVNKDLTYSSIHDMINNYIDMDLIELKRKTEHKEV